MPTREEKMEAILTNVNAHFDIPVIGEKYEKTILAITVGRALQHMPDQVLDILLSTSDGLSDQEIDLLREVAISYVNETVDIPYVPEPMEEAVIRPIVTYVFDAAKQGAALVTQ